VEFVATIALTYEPPMAGLKLEISVPVAVSNAAKFHRVCPSTWLNEPPTYSRVPSGETASAFTVPLMTGANEVATPVLML